ncbi:ligand-binding sensor domain-containing protein [Pedobacter faecalis]|uniref:ligand-binding sensor domain-containing protein n=1 Tax=Pedobacter faecalis TaxID=3041495 RepID=UPI00254B0FE9|nr:sensor histidine kinase [Pedobacter sp. ELA7]
MKRILTATLFAFIAITSNVIAQPYYFRNYRVEDGLSNNTIFTVTQDQRGFMWFGGKEGLIRFDGSNFKAYNEAGYPESVRGFILKIVAAGDGAIWMATRAGVYKFNDQTERFSLLKQIPQIEIEKLAVDSQANIWAIAGRKLYRYKALRKETKRFSVGQDADIATFNTNGEAMWLCTTSGYIYEYINDGDRFVCANPDHPLAAGHGRITTIYSAGSTVFLGSTTGLIAFDRQSRKHRYVISSNTFGQPVYVRNMLQKSENEFWIATEAGIVIYNRKTQSISRLTRSYTDPYALSDNAVYSLFKDVEGGIWAATYFGGLSYYHPRLSVFKKYFPNSASDAISGNAVREICKDEYGNLWVGTEDAGLNKIEKTTGKITSFRSAPKKGALSSDNVHGLLAQGKELWVGTFERGLDILDIKTGKVIRHYGAESSSSGLKTNFINVLYKTKSKIIYAGTDRGLYAYDPVADRFRLTEGLPGDCYVTTLLEDHEETLWVGTVRNGVFFKDRSRKKWLSYKHSDTEDNSLSNNMISDIFQDSDHHYWFATENGGLNFLDKNKRRFKRITLDDGLPSNLVLKTLEDAEKNIWVTTSKGLARYNRKAGNWTIFDQPQGLLTDQFNYNSGLNDKGTFYIGTIRGLISFQPAELQSSATLPRVYITSFKVYNTELKIDSSILKRSISYTDTVQLRHDQSSFSIGFSALSFIAPRVSQYLYKMDGLDTAWTFLKNNNIAHFTKLSPGTYRFRVKPAATADTLGAEQQLVIVIDRPFWLSNYALAVYGVLILGVSTWLISNYRRKSREKTERHLKQLALNREKEMYQSKMEFLTNVAHEIRTPLTLIKGPLEQVMDEVGQMKSVSKSLNNISRNTERLIKLSDQLLDFRRAESELAGKTSAQINLSACLQEIIDAYSDMVAKSEIRLKSQLQPGVLARIDEESFTKIVDNLIGNAVKYAKSAVYIEFQTVEKDADLCMKVANDGFVIPSHLKEKVFESFYRIPDTAHISGSGIGLTLARSLAELNGGTLVLETNEAMNIFVLKLPL